MIDACLGVNPNQTMTSARRLRLSRLFGRAPGGDCLWGWSLCWSLENRESCNADHRHDCKKFGIHSTSVSRHNH